MAFLRCGLTVSQKGRQIERELCGSSPTSLLTSSQSKWHYAQKASEQWGDTKPHCRHQPYYENHPPAGSKCLLISLLGKSKRVRNLHSRRQQTLHRLSAIEEDQPVSLDHVDETVEAILGNRIASCTLALQGLDQDKLTAAAKPDSLANLADDRH